MYEIITTVIKRSDDSAINVGYALVYQCLRTITQIYPSQELLDLATLTISRFLSSNSKNLKYMGIMGLIQIVRIDPKYTLDYQSMVVDCLEDADDTLKIRTLDLLYKMTNKQNVEPIVDKLLSYLKAAPIESSSRKDLVVKINEICLKHIVANTSPGRAGSLEPYINVDELDLNLAGKGRAASMDHMTAKRRLQSASRGSSRGNAA